MDRPANAVNEAFLMNSLRVKRLSPIFLFRWSKWGGLRLYGFELRFMGIMAVGTEKVSSLATPKISRSFPMDTCLPVSVDIPVAFAAEPVAFGEIDEFSVKKPKFVSIFCIVAVEAPSHGLRVMELDVRVFVFEFPLFPIDFHRGMTVAAGEHSLCQRRWRNRKLLLSPHHNGDKGNYKQKDEGKHKACFSHMCLNGAAGRKGGTNDLIPDDPFAKPAGTPPWSRLILTKK
jgi:hypothetical protein